MEKARDHKMMECEDEESTGIWRQQELKEGAFSANAAVGFGALRSLPKQELGCRMADCFPCESLLHAEQQSTENGDFRSHKGMSE